MSTKPFREMTEKELNHNLYHYRAAVQDAKAAISTIEALKAERREAKIAQLMVQVEDLQEELKGYKSEVVEERVSKNPVAIYDEKNRDMYLKSSEEVQKLWNDYANKSAVAWEEKNATVDLHINVMFQWTPNLSFSQWLKNKPTMDFYNS